VSTHPDSAAADTAAMLALAAGRDTALHELMDRWRAPLTAFLYRLTGCYETALDLAQETFVRIYQARARYDAAARFSTWLFAIAANLARNHARWRARHPEAPLPEDDTRHDPAADPAATAQAREKLRAVQHALAALPGDQREALILSAYHDLPHAEIATILHCTAKAVEHRIHRARQQLRTTLAAHGENNA
jgi:RNA polymerase sigma-70 factor (ECF subfamily)